MRLWSLVLAALVLVGCRAHPSDARPGGRAQPPLVWPVSYRFETVFFDVPLARAEQLVRAAQPADATLLCRVDELELRDRLLELSRKDDAIVCVVRDELVLRPGATGRVARRSGGLKHSHMSLASDAVDLEVTATNTLGWQAYDLSWVVNWVPDGGGRPVHFPASTPMPADLWLEISALPAQNSRTSDPRAVIGFVRAVPEWPETGDL